MSLGTVVGVGQCSWDLLSRVERFPNSDEKIDIQEWLEQGGGPVATALVTLKRLAGSEVGCEFHGICGDDREGQLIRTGLIEEGVNCPGLKTISGGSSQLSFVAVEKGTGHRTLFCRRPPANQDLLPSDVSGKIKGDLLLLDGVMEDASLAAAQEARNQGIPILLDSGRLRSRTQELAQICDYWVGSEVLARNLGWSGDPEPIREKWMIGNDVGPRVVTLTFGSRGSVTFTKDDYFETPAWLPPGEYEVVDTTGAGDVFHGAYAYGIINEWSLRKTATFASVVAGLKCLRLGGRTGIPTMTELKKILDFQNLT